MYKALHVWAASDNSWKSNVHRFQSIIEKLLLLFPWKQYLGSQTVPGFSDDWYHRSGNRDPMLTCDESMHISGRELWLLDLQYCTYQPQSKDLHCNTKCLRYIKSHKITINLPNFADSTFLYINGGSFLMVPTLLTWLKFNRIYI